MLTSSFYSTCNNIKPMMQALPTLQLSYTQTIDVLLAVCETSTKNRISANLEIFSARQII